MGKITLGDTIFAKQEDARSYLNDKMANYEIDTPIPDADIPLWFQVLQKHDWFDEYVTHGIHSFAATRSKQRPNLRNMVVVNDRGNQKPFSYYKYLSRGPLSKLAKVKAALRTEVSQQITDYKAKVFAGGATVLSAISGKPLTERRCHVHHSGKPFLQIVDEFLLSNKHRWNDLETESAGFHRTHAMLEVVLPEENLPAGKGGYRMSFKAP